MASVPHRLGEERATVPTVVLPITSRGLVVTDRVCWAILGVAMAVAAALILYFNRGTTFYVDQIIFLYQTPELGVGDVLDPHNGHLIVTTRLAFKAILETFGAEYVAFRVLGVGSVLLSAGFFYALVKRRIGALPALAPAFVLLFLGSAWQHVVGPIGFTPIFSIALGLAALLALERGDRVGDIAACALLIESVASYTSGLPFIVGAAISVLAFRDRWKRAWIFLVPLALYTVWWLWSQSQAGSSEGQTELQNALLIPTWEVESLAAALAAVTGLGFDFSGGSPPSIDLSAGRVLAVVAVIALALRIRRGNVPVAVWASLGIVVTWWALGSLAFGVGRAPDSVRYLYLGALGVMLVGVAAASGARFSRVGLVVLFGACALSLATNIVLLRDSGNYLRTVAATTRTELAMLELSRDRVDPGFNPAQPFGVESPLSITGTSASTYFGVADRYGSLAMPISELEASSENLRAHADRLLATALGLRLEGDPSPAPAQGCERVRSPAAGAPIGFALPAGGATLRAEGAGTVPVTLGRFAASPTVEAGSLTSGESATLRIPPDDSPRPWHATVTGGNSVTVCPLS